MRSARYRWFSLCTPLLAPGLYAQIAGDGGCIEIPREDALPAVCALPTSQINAPTR
jgi:hypothetical protein